MTGFFSEESLAKFAEMASQTQAANFSEGGGTYDFTRCVRPDGTAYGTRGRCRKGSEAAKAPTEPKAKKVAGNAGKGTETDMKGAHSAFKAAKAKEEEARRALATGKSPEAQQRHRDAYKAMSDAEKAYNKADVKDMAGLKAKAGGEAKPKRNLASVADAKKVWQSAYDADAAARKTLKQAEANLKAAAKVHKKENTPGSKKALAQATKAAIAAERAANRAQEAMWKAGDKYDAARKRETRRTETPAEKKARRQRERDYKMYG
jgi:hypothetical protein